MEQNMTANGYPWLGKVPTSWKMGRLGTMCSILTDGTHQTPTYVDAGIPFLSIKDVSSGYIDFSDAKMIPLEEHTELRRHAPVQRGDILFTRIGTLGKFVTVDTDVEFSIFVSLGLLRLKNNVPVTKDYLMYYLNSSAVQSYIQSIKAGFGTAAPKYNLSDAAHTPVLIPPKETQEAITRHLDVICQPIDMCSKDIKRQVDALEQYRRSVIHEAVTKGLNPDVPMKDSGIQWATPMPDTWSTVRGKYLFWLEQKPVRPTDEVITCFRDGEVTLRRNRREEGFTISEKEAGYQGIDEGDLVVHGMDGFAGSIGISDSRGKATPVLRVLGTNECKRYYMYYLRSMAYDDVFLATSTGIRVRSCDLSWKKLAEFVYPLPTRTEQEEIANYLDQKCDEIDSIIAAKKQQLETLSEYKKSLIYEYVTGKREVPA